MDTERHTEVIIVGAGPTGLALACQLIRYGIGFVIIDAAEGIAPFSKAIGVQARTLEIHEQIGLAASAVERGTIAQGARLVEGGEVRGEVALAEIGKGLSAYPYLLLLEQDKHQQLLNDYIEAAGEQVAWQSALEGFTQDDRGVVARVASGAGDSRTVATIHSKYLVGCDGAKSLVRHTLGLTFEGSTFDRLFYVADVQVAWKFSHEFVHICFAENTLTAFFPMRGEQRWRIVGTFPEDTDKREGEVLYEEIERQIAADTKLDVQISHVNWFSVYKVNTRRVNRFQSGRCFVAGDAAHIHSPAGAQGMNTGIQDAYNLAWKLALVLRGKAGAGLLETYDEERAKNAKHLLATTDRMFEFGAGDEWFLVFFRSHILPHIADKVLHVEKVRHFIFELVSQTGINYRGCALSRHDGGLNLKVRPGDRMPYFLVDGASVYDRLRLPVFHLLMFGDASGDEHAAQALHECGDGEWIDCHALALTPQAQEAFGSREPFEVLLRPDNYIGAIAPRIARDQISSYLRAAAATPARPA